MTFVLLLACTAPPADDSGAPDPPDPPDPATVLVELADVFSTDVFVAVYFAVGNALLWEMEAHDTLSGTLAFPADADPGHWDVDGTLELDWAVTHREDATTEGLRYWDWEVAVDLTSLTLPSARVSGTAAWTFTWEQYDYAYGHHAWSGTVSIDGAEPVLAAWTSVGTGSTLNAMEGTIDGTPVAWENEHPDVP